MLEVLQTWLKANPALAPWATGVALLALDILIYLIARNFLARGVMYIAQHTKNKVDDVIVRYLRPFRLALIAPLLLTYYLASWFPQAADIIRQVVLLLILWLVVLTVNALFDAFNVIHEQSENYRGVSIQSYLDVGKLLAIIVGIILTASQITGKSPIVLLTGLGAVMALLVLIFQDTLLSLVASLQIQSHDLVREQDWIEMPAYEADGIVMNISLHTIRVQNWDNTFTVIPTHKLLNTPYRNWRGMQESGGRRIKRAIYVDINSIKLVDTEMLGRLRQVALVRNYVDQQVAQASKDNRTQLCEQDVCRELQLTNVGVFRAYMGEYLKNRQDLHQTSPMAVLVRQLAPEPTGMPLEVYAFTKTTNWEAYEAIQADIFEHLVAVAPKFGLQVFQEPTGSDFRMLLKQTG